VSGGPGRGGEPLPERAVERLLADAEPLLEEVAGVAAGPRRIGKYRLVRRIGRGGMGVVHEALDEELGRTVALKLLDQAARGDAALRERFLREARAAARLAHPNIAAVFDAGDGWLAMRRVDGPPLHLAPPSDLRTKAGWVRDAALAVQHAHEAGIVHRDVKPHNLLLEEGRVFVTDFGLAKEIDVDSSLSRSGHLLGSPSYMAPEQAQGRVHAVDARTDVFGLGATLYHLLTGRPPFVGEDVVQLVRRIVDEEPLRPAALAPGVPRDLETIVLKCLEKEPIRRYATARALAEDLDRWLRGEPVLARRPSLTYRGAKFARRHRAGVALSLLCAVALAGWGAAAWNERVRRAASAEALALAESVFAVIADHGTHQRLGESEAARARLEEGAAACRAFLARHDVAQAHWLLGRLERKRGRAAESEAALDRALALDPRLADARLERGLLRAHRFASARAGSAPADGAPSGLLELRAGALADLEAAERDAGRLSAVSAAHARAELLRLRGDRAGALRAFQELARLDPVSVEAAVALSQLELDEGRDEAAWHGAMSVVDLELGLGPAYVARSGRDAASGRAAAPHSLAPERLRVEDVEGALVDFTRALEADPRDAFAWGNRALVQARRAARRAAEGDDRAALQAWDAAIADATHALALEPALAGAWNNRAVSRAEKERLLTRLGRAEEAAAEQRLAGEDLDEALRLNPRFALARLNRAAQRRRVAEEAARRGDRERSDAARIEAEEDAREALRLRPGDASAWVERALVRDLEADLRAARGDLAGAGHARDLARADWDVAVGLERDEPRTLGLRGVHRARAHDPAGARADLEAALSRTLDRDLRARLESELAALAR